MDVFTEIAAERRGLADLLAGTTEEQRTTPSLCAGWTVHDVVGHLVVPLEVGLPTFVLTMLRSAGSFDRANDRLARRQSRRPFDELLEVLRRKADHRFTPPGAGPEAPLTDVLVHGLDIRRPLGLTRAAPADRIRTSLAWLVTPSARGLVGPRLSGLAYEATDLDWRHGDGPAVRGTGEAVLLALTGRRAALDELDGDGVPQLRHR